MTSIDWFEVQNTRDLARLDAVKAWEGDSLDYVKNPVTYYRIPVHPYLIGYYDGTLCLSFVNLERGIGPIDFRVEDEDEATQLILSGIPPGTILELSRLVPMLGYH